MGTKRIKFSKTEAKRLAEGLEKEAEKQTIKETLKTQAKGGMGCSYCIPKILRGDKDLPRWKLWTCPKCFTGRFLTPTNVKDIEDLM